MSIFIKQVNYHRNGSSGNGLSVARAEREIEQARAREDVIMFYAISYFRDLADGEDCLRAVRAAVPSSPELRLARNSFERWFVVSIEEIFGGCADGNSRDRDVRGEARSGRSRARTLREHSR